MAGLDRFLSDLALNAPLILSGLRQTIALAATVSVTGLLGGILVFRGLLARSAFVRRATEAYVSFFIGTPLIVLLFLAYYGLPQWGWKASSWTVAVIGFTLNVAAYNAAHLMSARRGLDDAELDAARAQGFSQGQSFRYVVLPQVLRLALPTLASQVVLNLKDSTVAFLIQFTDFFARVQEVAAGNFQFFHAYTFAALVYLVLVGLLVLGARALERRVRLPGLST